jgi:hypothetical protein
MIVKTGAMDLNGALSETERLRFASGITLSALVEACEDGDCEFTSK